MKSDSGIFDNRVTLTVIVMIFAAVLNMEVFGQDHAALLLRQTPPQGGKVTPSAGLHNFALHSDVILTAVPKPGWRFVYWLGDVTEPESNNTVAFLDSPKIVIAVFEREEYEFKAFTMQAKSRPGGGLYGSPSDYSRQGGGGGGSPPEPPPPPPPPIDEDDDVPVPIPEPGTGLLLIAGVVLGVVRRGRLKC